jgi:hypothetical protein
MPRGRYDAPRDRNADAAFYAVGLSPYDAERRHFAGADFFPLDKERRRSRVLALVERCREIARRR